MARQILVILGTEGRPPLPSSDRVALGIAVSELDGRVAACIGAADSEASRYAAAAGVEQFLEPEALEDCAFDVALLGRGGCRDADDSGDLLPARLAELRDAALVYEVIDVHSRADGLEVTRDLGRGARDILCVRGPAVLVIADSAPSRGYISRRRVLTADVPRAESSAPPGKASPIAWQPTSPRVRLGDHAVKVEGSATTRMNDLFGLGASRTDASHIVTGSPETCARHLLRYLVHHDFIALDMAEATEPVKERPARPPSIRETHTTKSDTRAPRPVSGRGIPRRAPRRLQG